MSRPSGWYTPVPRQDTSIIASSTVVTVLSNGSETYGIYIRTSTGASGAQFLGGGSEVKFSLGGP
jgi:hypothetical protein